MGADSLAENTPNAPEFICPKVLDFNEKRLHWVFVVRDLDQKLVPKWALAALSILFVLLVIKMKIP